MFLNALFQGYFTEVSFDTSERNQLSHFQNGYFFKILWSFNEPQNQVKCRLKNKMHFLNFSLMKNNKIDCLFYIEMEYTYFKDQFSEVHLVLFKENG